jgi:pimeloyl-ACP methyl ester carboxylesterase
MTVVSHGVSLLSGIWQASTPASIRRLQSIVIDSGLARAGGLFMRPSALSPRRTREQVFADLQRRTISGEVAARLKACDAIDVVDELPRVAVPTMVLHALHDQVVSIDQGRMIAAHVPGARFVALESENHIPIPGEPAWERLVREIETFSVGD